MEVLTTEKLLLGYIALAILQFFFFLTMKRRTLFFIKEVGINFKYYPKHYVLPCHFVRKFFRLKKEKIAKYLYCSLCISLAFFISIVIVPIIGVSAFFSQYISAYIAMIIFWMDILIGLLVTIALCIISHFYKKR